MNRLPSLEAQPKHYAGCCLALSTTLLSSFTSLCLTHVKAGLVVSIGSGTGLFEAHLQRIWSGDSQTEHRHDLTIEGVEVLSSDGHGGTSNVYLLEETISYVRGTWEVCTRAVDNADVLMFVYPRQPELVRTYICRAAAVAAAADSKARLLVWLGPKVDWDTAFQSCFRDDTAAQSRLRRVETGDFDGLAGYETVAAFVLTPVVSD